MSFVYSLSPPACAVTRMSCALCDSTSGHGCARMCPGGAGGTGSGADAIGPHPHRSLHRWPSGLHAHHAIRRREVRARAGREGNPDGGGGRGGLLLPSVRASVLPALCVALLAPHMPLSLMPAGAGSSRVCAAPPKPLTTASVPAMPSAGPCKTLASSSSQLTTARPLLKALASSSQACTAYMRQAMRQWPSAAR